MDKPTVAPDEMLPDLGFVREYRLLKKIGQGGMGAVYKAMHTRLKRVVAIKLLPEERMHDEAAVRRFAREMEAVGKLEHPHIVKALDAGEEAGRLADFLLKAADSELSARALLLKREVKAATTVAA